jgi:hypothetical protein
VVEQPVIHAEALVAEVQFPAKEEDSDPVIRGIAEPSGDRFQGLDLTVEPFADGIGYAV